MALTAQDDVKVVEFDVLTERPDPGMLPAGVIGHEKSTNKSYITAIDTLTGVRRWDPLGAGNALLKFAGGGSLTSGPFTIADESGLNSSFDVGAAKTNYPLIGARIATNLAVRMRANSSGTTGVGVALLAGGVALLTVTFPLGTANVTTNTLLGVTALVPAGSILDLQVQGPTAATGLLISATVELA